MSQFIFKTHTDYAMAENALNAYNISYSTIINNGNNYITNYILRVASAEISNADKVLSMFDINFSIVDM
jgi:hypothetical protein